MAISLYDVSVGTFLQILASAEGFLAKGLAHCTEKGIDPGEIVETRLFPDMLPFRFQVVSLCHHSRGAVDGAMAGLFSPPKPAGEDYAGLQNLVSEARAHLAGIKADAVNALEGKDVTFALGDRKIPFKAQDFLMTFSLPNFYFHATTTYDILRQKGVPLGKRDFIGRMKIAA